MNPLQDQHSLGWNLRMAAVEQLDATFLLASVAGQKLRKMRANSGGAAE
jgi:hypothetical protein